MAAYILSILGEVAGLIGKGDGMSQSVDEILGERKGSKNARNRRLRLGKTDFDLGLVGG